MIKEQRFCEFRNVTTAEPYVTNRWMNRVTSKNIHCNSKSSPWRPCRRRFAWNSNPMNKIKNRNKLKPICRHNFLHYIPNSVRANYLWQLLFNYEWLSQNNDANGMQHLERGGWSSWAGFPRRRSIRASSRRLKLSCQHPRRNAD